MVIGYPLTFCKHRVLYAMLLFRVRSVFSLMFLLLILIVIFTYISYGFSYFVGKPFSSIVVIDYPLAQCRTLFNQSLTEFGLFSLIKPLHFSFYCFAQ